MPESQVRYNFYFTSVCFPFDVVFSKKSYLTAKTKIHISYAVLKVKKVTLLFCRVFFFVKSCKKRTIDVTKDQIYLGHYEA